MRILHFLWGFSQGGSESLAVDLANKQCLSNEVIVLVGNDKADDFLVRRLNPAVRFIHLGRPEGSRNPYWIIKLLSVIHSIRPDVIHSHSNKLASLAPFIAAPLLLTVHSNNNSLSAHASKFSAICCISKAVEDDIKGRYPHLATRLIPNGIDTSVIPVRSAQSSGSFRAVQVSRLVHETKGQDLLIAALKTINDNQDMPLITVDFIGDGPSMPYLTDLVRSKNASEYCRFLGAKSRDEVFATLQNYSLLIQPSRDEGFGLTVAEGMAAGLPVLISDLPGPMEVIDKGKHGYFFKSGDVDALVSCLRTAITEIDTPAAATRLAAARQYVIDNYDLAATSDNYFRIYQELVSSS